jgi:hygromycin-B 4-O-kinase
MTPRPIDPGRARAFLASRFDSVSDLVGLSGGEWSTAFGFRAGDRRLVVRFGAHLGDYEKDQLAASWTTPDLPVPEVLDVGPAFDGAFAISEWKTGTRLDELEPGHFAVVADALLGTLAEIGRIELAGDGFGAWRAPDCAAPHATWSEALLAVAHRHDDRLRGWSTRLAQVPEAQHVFERGYRRLRSIVAVCPDRRRVVHGDLLAGNVLVDDGRISAVFDWGNSLAGDPLYDVAGLCFWSRWHRGIDGGLIRRLAAERFGEADVDDRLRCYELHIALDALQYQAFAGRRHELTWTTEQVMQLLEP